MTTRTETPNQLLARLAGLRPRAILAARYPARIPSVVERALVHLDRGDGRSLCRAALELMMDESYDPGPATCARCLARAERAR